MGDNFFSDIFDPDYEGRPYIVAEISANHDGSLSKLLETIDAAQASGCDAVKIQTYTAETMTLDVDQPDFLVKEGLWGGRKLFDLYKEAETPYEWHTEIFAHAEKLGLPLFSTPFDETAIDLLVSLDAKIFKIGSPEMLDLLLIEYAAKTGRPLVLSTGMALLEEVDEVVALLQKLNIPFLLLHCVSSYPTEFADAAVGNIAFLAARYKCRVGLSDHTLGSITSVLATAMRVPFIEKHFTLERENGGVDSAFSLEPAEMRQLVDDVAIAHAALGDEGDYKKSDNALGNRIYRRSLYFVRPLAAGDVIGDEDVRRVRPGYGLPCSALPQVLGKRVIAPVVAGDPVTQAVLDD